MRKGEPGLKFNEEVEKAILSTFGVLWIYKSAQTKEPEKLALMAQVKMNWMLKFIKKQLGFLKINKEETET